MKSPIVLENLYIFTLVSIKLNITLNYKPTLHSTIAEKYLSHIIKTLWNMYQSVVESCWGRPFQVFNMSDPIGYITYFWPQHAF